MPPPSSPRRARNCCAPKTILRAAKAGGRSDRPRRPRASSPPPSPSAIACSAITTRCTRLIAQQAATKDELAANDLELTKAQAEVTRLTAAKQEFDRGVKLDAGALRSAVQQAQSEVAALEEKVRTGRITAPVRRHALFAPGQDRRLRQDRRPARRNGRSAQGPRSRVHRRARTRRLEPGQQVRITWDALPNRTWIGKTEVIPKQVVARGARSVGELLCNVDNEKLELLPNINVNVRINSQGARRTC